MFLVRDLSHQLPGIFYYWMERHFYCWMEPISRCSKGLAHVTKYKTDLRCPSGYDISEY